MNKLEQSLYDNEAMKRQLEGKDQEMADMNENVDHLLKEIASDGEELRRIVKERNQYQSKVKEKIGFIQVLEDNLKEAQAEVKRFNLLYNKTQAKINENIAENQRLQWNLNVTGEKLKMIFNKFDHLEEFMDQRKKEI